MKTSHPSRREFLQTTAVAASALAFPHIGSSQVLGANERIGFAGYQLDPAMGHAVFLQKWL